MKLDDVARDVRYAWRTLRRAPLVAVTIVVTVGLGLGLVAAAYTMLSSVVFSADDVRRPDELFAVERVRSALAEPAAFTRAEHEALDRETNGFVDSFATTGDVQAYVEGVRREGRLVTGNFFQLLGVGAARGRVFAPADDEPGSAAVMVLSHRAWQQQYESDPGIVGRTYRVNGTQFEIIGVTPDGFRGLELVAPDFWVPLAQSAAFVQPATVEGAFDGTSGLTIVGRLAPGVTVGQAQAQLAAWDAQRELARGGDALERAATSLVLTPRRGTMPQPADALLAFTPLFFAFGLILMIGCANVANLLLARLVARQREIGIRLSIGASRRRVVWQLLTESLLLALVSAAFAFAISRLALNAIVYFIVTSFPPDIGNLRIAVPAADWRVGVFLVVGAFVATVLFALAPALRATRVELARAVHGAAFGDARPGRARNALIALQVTGSALLLICAAIFLRGAWQAANADPGVRTAGVLSVAVLDEQRRNDILQAIAAEPSVAAVAAAWPGFMGGVAGAPAYGEGASGRQVVRYAFASPELFDVLELPLVRGRGFTTGERNPNEAVAIVSETVARELWPGADALGQVLRLEPDPTIVQGAAAAPAQPSDDPLLQARTAVVIGVARDVAGFSIGGVRIGGAGVYLPIDASVPATGLTLRVRGDEALAERALVDRFAARDPNMAEIEALAMFARADVYILGTSFWLTLVLGVLALLLTLSGLFSVLSYLVEQRRRELGVRMALGAGRFSVGALVLKQCAWPVGIGLGIGCTLTIGVSAALLATPAAEQIGAIVSLFDPVAYGASLVCIVTACAGAALIPALRAGRVNPLVALRHD
jgi:predicted permease